ncbi:DUF6255 family natural product biosynthesis protein [Streptomyces sp. UNOB3_S3]|uniref:DUF6255 family natural product biosynthesis protein n=1 Tax=Streptomyces sp. UNOB3_S3 TaxID=2871682 RepID=UPI001EE6080D|nr:DUF6255 family natural product biosynthesis protein [Streptomyces sp. UNOB3_S3]
MPGCEAGAARCGVGRRCRTCGVRRFTDYGALRPPGLPQAVVPAPRDRRAADRAAARRVAELLGRGRWWSLRRRVVLGQECGAAVGAHRPVLPG